MILRTPFSRAIQAAGLSIGVNCRCSSPGRYFRMIRSRYQFAAHVFSPGCGIFSHRTFGEDRYCSTAGEGAAGKQRTARQLRLARCATTSRVCTSMPPMRRGFMPKTNTAACGRENIVGGGMLKLAVPRPHVSVDGHAPGPFPGVRMAGDETLAGPV